MVLGDRENHDQRNHHAHSAPRCGDWFCNPGGAHAAYATFPNHSRVREDAIPKRYASCIILHVTAFNTLKGIHKFIDTDEKLRDLRNGMSDLPSGTGYPSKLFPTLLLHIAIAVGVDGRVLPNRDMVIPNIDGAVNPTVVVQRVAFVVLAAYLECRRIRYCAVFPVFILLHVTAHNRTQHAVSRQNTWKAFTWPARGS